MVKEISRIKQAVLDLTVNVDSRSLRLCETVQNDILGRLATPHGIAPYQPKTQVVQREQAQQSFAVDFMPSRSSGAKRASAAGSSTTIIDDTSSEAAGVRARKKLRVTRRSAALVA